MTPRQALKILAEQYHIPTTRRDDNLSYDQVRARNALTDALAVSDFEVDEIQFLPKASTRITGDDIEMFNKFIDMLNDLDDVQQVYHDAEF